MQVFCDESGGSDAANSAFLVAAAAIQPADAARLVKSFRKATGFPGEIKGSKLSMAQRATFLGLLARQPDAASVVVACRRSAAVGGWAMGALTEAELYGHLLAEACVALPGLSAARHVSVTPDQLRYSKDRAEVVRTGLIGAIAIRHPAAKVAVGFGNSAELAGLQVADAVANSVFQVLVPSPVSEAVKPMLAPLLARGSLTIRDVQLSDRRPAWLVGQ